MPILTTDTPVGNKTKVQVKAIWSRARQRAMTDDQLHDLVEAETGQRSIRALNRAQADKVIVALGGVPLTKKPRRTRQHHHQKHGVKQIVSDEQLKLLNDLAARRNISPDGMKRLCQRMLRKDAPTTTIEANKIIEALKAMNARDDH